jgi:beta-glucosidase
VTPTSPPAAASRTTGPDDLLLPAGFLVGTATAAHQVEGGNVNSDWWAWEHHPDTTCAESSGDACDHARRYRDDIRMLADLGFRHYRFSVEWARVEPAPGEWSRAWLDHYADVARTCRAHGVEPSVTLHHFTSPRWLHEDGRRGWQDPEAPERFARYCRRVVGHLGAHVDRWWTVNEPNIVAHLGYGTGLFAPGVADAAALERACVGLTEAHRVGVDAVRSLDPRAEVGMTLAVHEWTELPGGAERLAELRAAWEDRFLAATEGDDVVGVQTYTNNRVGPDGFVDPDPALPLTQMGWEVRPQALEVAVRRVHEVTGLPVLVSENGIATDDDDLRIAFTARALRGVLACVADGIDVRGYTAWSLLDNFEWAEGYRPTFGLVAVDRTTFARTVKPSARWLGQVGRSGRVPVLPTPPGHRW